jgi:hypothetical protein
MQQITGWPRTGQPIDPLTGLETIARWLIYGNTAQKLGWEAYLWPLVFGLALLAPDWLKHRQQEWWRRSVPLAWLLITVIPLFAFGLFREANLKFLLPAQIALALILGRGIWYLWELGSGSAARLIEALPRILAVTGLVAMLSFMSNPSCQIR